LFIEEKELLAGGKDEIASAIGTFENFVDEIHPASLAFVPKHPFKQRETDGAPGSPGILGSAGLLRHADRDRTWYSRLRKGPWWQPEDSGQPGRHS